jgi:acylphosphatase
MPVRSVHIIIGGRVQGVGFRYFAKHKADELQIAGWVRNTPDGKVEIEAEAELQNLENFIEWLKIGPSRAIISTFSATTFEPPRNFRDFTIR